MGIGTLAVNRVRFVTGVGSRGGALGVVKEDGDGGMTGTRDLFVEVVSGLRLGGVFFVWGGGLPIYLSTYLPI